MLTFSLNDMKHFVNLTLHDINIVDNDNNIIYKINASGTDARIDEEKTQICEIGGIQINEKKFIKVIDLPAPERNTYYIVSENIARMEINERNDLLIPDKAVIDESIGIIGYRALSRLSK